GPPRPRPGDDRTGPGIAAQGRRHQDAGNVLTADNIGMYVPNRTALWAESQGYSCCLVSSMVQFVSQVRPPSAENACSHRIEVGVMSDQIRRVKTCFPSKGSCA